MDERIRSALAFIVLLFFFLLFPMPHYSRGYDYAAFVPSTGDTWTYSEMTVYSSGEEQESFPTVEFVGEKTFNSLAVSAFKTTYPETIQYNNYQLAYYAYSEKGMEFSGLEEFTGEKNVFETNVTTPSLVLKYPLTVGDSWNTSYAVTYSDFSGEAPNIRIFWVAEIVVVSSKENVTVPAGTFECFVVQSNLTKISGPITEYKSTSRWYSPELKNYVKITSQQFVYYPTQNISAYYEATLTNYSVSSK